MIKCNLEKKRRWSGELSSPKELVEKTPYIRLGNEEKLDKKEGDEDVLNKSLPGDSISVEAGAASITKEDVTELAEAAEEVAAAKAAEEEAAAEAAEEAAAAEAAAARAGAGAAAAAVAAASCWAPGAVGHSAMTLKWSQQQ